MKCQILFPRRNRKKKSKKKKKKKSKCRLLKILPIVLSVKNVGFQVLKIMDGDNVCN